MVDAKLLIDINRKELRDAEAQGLTSVSTTTLHSIFDKIEQHVDTGPAQPSAIELETFRSDLAGSLAYQDHVNTWNLEGFRQVIALGQSTLKSIMLINGGAAVALLAFLGSLVSAKTRSVPLLSFANSMQAFVWGVFLAAVAYGLTYFSQLCYGGEKKWQQRTGVVLHVLTSLVATAALLMFLWGAKLAYLGFVGFAP